MEELTRSETEEPDWVQVARIRALSMSMADHGSTRAIQSVADLLRDAYRLGRYHERLEWDAGRNSPQPADGGSGSPKPFSAGPMRR